MSQSVLLKSSLSKKYFMGFTGLFLCVFLLGHLAGNLQLLIPLDQGARDTFNLYAEFMTTNPLVKIMSYITYFSILFHAVDGILLTIQNKKARPTAYTHSKPSANSTMPSRFMAQLGVLILIFIVVHLYAFWAKMHFGPIESYMVDGRQIKDLYSIVLRTFQDSQLGLVVSLVYVFFMAVVGLHLAHGFQSGFQSLGLNHPKYSPLIKKVGTGFAIVIPAAFAIIPLWIHFVIEKI